VHPIERFVRDEAVQGFGPEAEFGPRGTTSLPARARGSVLFERLA
jgi:hypothetical protein